MSTTSKSAPSILGYSLLSVLPACMLRGMSFLNNLSFSRLTHTLCRIATIQEKKLGELVMIKGWIQNIRKLKKNLFLDVNDGSSCQSIQIVAERGDSFKPGIGDSIEVLGELGQAPNGNPEIQAKTVNILGLLDPNGGYPFTPRQVHSPEYIRDYLHLRPKVDRFASLLRVRHWATKYYHDFFANRDFIQIQTPVITSNDCEGAGEVFLVKPDNEKLLKSMQRDDKSLDEAYFDKKAFLSVSGQLSLEAVTQGLGNVYTFMPAFRAENSKSPLHITEFHMLEGELAFTSDIIDVVTFIEDMIKDVTKCTIDKCSTDIANCVGRDIENEVDMKSLLDKKWKILTYDDAVEILMESKDKFKSELKYEEGLSKEHELFLVKTLNSPIFVTQWPKSMKPFYMKISDVDSTKVEAIDLLMPRVGELVGGSLRENNYDRLAATVPPGLEWYADLRKFGYVPTGGFGLGFERYLQLLTGIKNIRDVIPFPRWPHSCRM